MSHILCYIQPSGAPNTTQPNTTPQITNYLGAALLQQTPPLLDAQQPRTVPSGCLVRNFNGSTISQQCVCSLQHQQPSYPSCNRPFLPRHRPHPGVRAPAPRRTRATAHRRAGREGERLREMEGGRGSAADQTRLGSRVGGSARFPAPAATDAKQCNSGEAAP